ncbi:hypothetical protein [Actinopolymorpha pittospori]|uniref:Uncharacterized protein n=1 Tax=Actinopolymorpha pittospori TaxID=648752 RepID=A0A927R991_9ACTN|nr:hypothetical protein [Actinopolymorpha pittospori]MBE1603750.1 hypothetical protein [Actinopolymorpha pittospori]
MVYVLTLNSFEFNEIRAKLSLDQVFTRTVPAELRPPARSPQLAVVFVAEESDPLRSAPSSRYGSLHLDWLGAVMRPHGEKVASLGYRIKVDHIRPNPAPIPLRKILDSLNAGVAEQLDMAIHAQTRALEPDIGELLLDTICKLQPPTKELVTWLRAVVETDQLQSGRPEDDLWREERDALRTALRIGGFPLDSLSAWRRPDDSSAPYLSGLIAEPNEQSIIEHDAHILDNWANRTPGGRCDIHVITDGERRLEIANVNATKVEARLGTDLIYYHENTQSFTLVQYKRLDRGTKSIRVNPRLRNQMKRLGRVSELSRDALKPDEWRIGKDCCFLKLALWEDDDEAHDTGMTKGMYIPLSYAELLIDDETRRGPQGGDILGYENVDRYLINTQFIELLKDGLVGTVGTSAETLRNLVTARAREHNGLVVAAERGSETAAERRKRNRSRGSKAKAAQVKATGRPKEQRTPAASTSGSQDALFPI